MSMRFVSVLVAIVVLAGAIWFVRPHSSDTLGSWLSVSSSTPQEASTTPTP